MLYFLFRSAPRDRHVAGNGILWFRGMIQKFPPADLCYTQWFLPMSISPKKNAKKTHN